MAVFTKLNLEDFNNIIVEYDIGELKSFSPINEGVENTNYLLETTKDKFIFTIFEKRVNYDEVPFFLDLMDFLSVNNFISPKVLKKKNKANHFTYNNKLGIIISFLEGSNKEEVNNDLCFDLGVNLARMHISLRKFQGRRENNLGAKNIDLLYSSLKEFIEPDIISVIEKNLLKISSQEDLPKSIIHADLFPDNVFVKNKKISGIIDFYFSCYDAMILDIAICINSWCFDKKNIFISLRYMKIIEGYNSVRELESKEKLLLNDFCIFAAIRFFLTRLNDKIHHQEGVLVNVKDPREYLEKIIFFNSIP